MFKNFVRGGGNSERCPKYCVKRLTLKEMAEICIGKKIDQDLVCQNVPYAKKSNAVNVIDINYVPLNDLSVDGLFTTNILVQLKMLKLCIITII